MRTQAKGEEGGMEGGSLPIVREASLKRRVETQRRGWGAALGCNVGEQPKQGGAETNHNGGMSSVKAIFTSFVDLQLLQAIWMYTCRSQGI